MYYAKCLINWNGIIIYMICRNVNNSVFYKVNHDVIIEILNEKKRSSSAINKHLVAMKTLQNKRALISLTFVLSQRKPLK